MMKETNIQSQVTSTIVGDDGEAMAKSEENAKEMAPKKPNEGLEKPDDAGWYVAVDPLHLSVTRCLTGVSYHNQIIQSK